MVVGTRLGIIVVGRHVGLVVVGCWVGVTVGLQETVGAIEGYINSVTMTVGFVENTQTVAPLAAVRVPPFA